MTKIGVYYYPGWHRQESLSDYHSDDEWDVVRNAKPYFEGHHQPRIPTLGYLDDALESTLKLQSDLALDHGVDAFIFDWYWKKGQKYFESSVRSFMKLETKLDFALMWSWKLPRKEYPITLSESTNWNDNRWVETNIEDFKDMITHCSERYFNRKNYWTVEGKPYFVMYFIEGFVNKIGHQALSEMISEGNSIMRKKGYPGLYTVGVVSDPPKDSGEYPIKDLGFDALTGYNFLADFKPSAPLFQDYRQYADKRASDWEKILSKSGLPYVPSISAGWDATPRGERVEKLEEGMIFPWSPIVMNNTPENFARHLKQAKDFIMNNGLAGTENDVIHICAWNEWSEGAYLEPDMKYGTQFLEKIKGLKE